MFKDGLMDGQRILITGGGTGLGAAMSTGFLAAGADVVICGRRKAVLEATAVEWRETFPQRRIDCFDVDIRDAAAVEAMVEAIWSEGPLTGLVNNAAGNFIAQTHDLSPRGFDAVANIVFHGTFYVTQAVGKRWIAETKNGAWSRGVPFRNVLSIITSWVDTGAPFVVPSAMSKAGVEVMTRSLAVEWARYGIRLNAVAPGVIPTDGMTNRLDPATLSDRPLAAGPGMPMARVGEKSELQNLATFLMAPGQCDWISGQSITMDGANALANGADFYELTQWDEGDWATARARIETQNRKDKS